MSDVVVVSDDTPEPPPVVVVESDDSEDVVMDATTIDLVERVTRIEDAIALVTVGMETLTEQVASLQVTDEIQQMEIQAVAEETEEVATEAADAIEETVEDIDEASPEIKPDELPTVREHFFFRKWGKR